MDNCVVNLDNYPKTGEHQEYIHPFSLFFKIVKGKDSFPFQKKWYVYDTEYAPDGPEILKDQGDRCFNTPENAYRYLLKKYKKYLRRELNDCEAEIKKFN